DKHCTDHEIRMRDRLFDRITRGRERLNLREEDVVELTQTIEIPVDDRNACAKADGHFRSFGADDAAAENDDIRRRNSRNSAETNTASAVHLLKIRRTDLNGHTARNLGHRRKKRQAAVLRDRLVGNARYFPLEHLLCKLRFGSKVQIREKQLIFTHTRIFGSDRLLDLNDHIARLPNFVCGIQQLSASLYILLISKPRAFARSFLHKDLM